MARKNTRTFGLKDSDFFLGNDFVQAEQNLIICDILINKLQKSIQLIELKKNLANVGQLRTQQKQVGNDG